MRTRRRMRLELAIAVIVLAAVVVVLLATRGSNAGASGPVPSSKPAARRFAHDYLRYLDGTLPASQLAGATAAVRAHAGEIIPASERAGRLRLTRLIDNGVRGGPSAPAALVARDRRHTLSAPFTLVYEGGRWRVVKLAPPDLVTALRSLKRPVLAGAGAARRVVERFSQQYVDHADGRSPRLPDAPAAVLAQIKSGQDPLASLPASHRRARVLNVRFGPPGPSVDAIVSFRTGATEHTFALVLRRSAGAWVVSQLIDGSLGIQQ